MCVFMGEHTHTNASVCISENSYICVYSYYVSSMSLWMCFTVPEKFELSEVHHSGQNKCNAEFLLSL